MDGSFYAIMYAYSTHMCDLDELNQYISSLVAPFMQMCMRNILGSRMSPRMSKLLSLDGVMHARSDVICSDKHIKFYRF